MLGNGVSSCGEPRMTESWLEAPVSAGRTMRSFGTGMLAGLSLMYAEEVAMMSVYPLITGESAR